MNCAAPAQRSDVDRRVGDEFVDLLLADDEWVDAEFDAIIAASCGAEAGNPNSSDRGFRRPGFPHAPVENTAAQDRETPAPSVTLPRAPGRIRSPPVVSGCTDPSEGRW